MRAYLKSLNPIWLYPALTLVSTAFAFLAAESGVWCMFVCLRFAFGHEKIYWVKHIIRDSTGFALLSAGLALTQYFLASSLVLSMKDRVLAFSVLFFSASASGVFFARLAADSSLGVSRLCSFPVITACLFGGLTALFQKESENPMRGLKFNPFKY
ncbi:MAG: hypothetical protein A2X34_09120 [Elusimicrobia bacterium GWC2_51_8]|nr:MAG: hypothetical protein A2X33_06535 [Elusimicrobia bacterium GWA2_51_34]OGR57743.1 MAG: hypothetical protein A2X34_09120 [Elusimicrobia bacterium GWC2_51_8]OGR87767.1 MAG: hypothetical protein A2021_01345 [Elusimicrobia bacterium GWF2_52_66]HAF95345.1 hypothetical protein [Elusimicrobiota bacterium]HCE97375.1 hypothetical protein [Elusimicrobiota bacterium]